MGSSSSPQPPRRKDSAAGPSPAALRVLLATRNRHKVAELQGLVGPAVPCLALVDLPDAPPLTEDGDTFAANAAGKVLQLAAWLTRHPAPHLGSLPQSIGLLADDSGLEVDALNGAPGVRSARFALAHGAPDTGNAPDAANNERLLHLLADSPAPRRTARFRCVLAWARVGVASVADVALFEGTCEGRIGFAPRGTNGFGYDPLFIPDGFEQSFAELGDALKQRISHRARALQAWRQTIVGGASPRPDSPR